MAGGINQLSAAEAVLRVQHMLTSDEFVSGKNTENPEKEGH